MASFLRHINGVRNWRLHMFNEAYHPNPVLWHDLAMGSTAGEPVSYGPAPKCYNLAADNILSYVLARRPEWREYPWTARSDLDSKYYVHPARKAQFRIIELMENDKTMSREAAFAIVDKELRKIKEDMDLQVAVARESAARMGVPNQGPAGLFERAAKVYEAVHELQQENAERIRREELKLICEQRITFGHRLSMDDLDIIPFQDERMQFFTDYPEYRELFPPAWHTIRQVEEERKLAAAIRSRADRDELDEMIHAEGGDVARGVLRSSVMKHRLAPSYSKIDEDAPEWPTAEMYESAKRAKNGLDPARTRTPPTENDLKLQHERDVEKYDRQQLRMKNTKLSAKDLASAKDVLDAVKNYPSAPHKKIALNKEEMQDYLGPNQLMDLLQNDTSSDEVEPRFRKPSELPPTLHRRDYSIFKPEFAFEKNSAKNDRKVVEYSTKLAHDYEDKLPIKSKEYLQECDELGRPIGLPYDPSVVSSNTSLLTMVQPDLRKRDFVEETIYGAVDQWQTLWPVDEPESCIYKGPKYIRDHFPEAYKIAVKKVEEEVEQLEKKPGPNESTYKGLWRSLKQKEGKKVAEDREEVLPRSLWQRQVDLNPLAHRITRTNDDS